MSKRTARNRRRQTHLRDDPERSFGEYQQSHCVGSAGDPTVEHILERLYPEPKPKVKKPITIRKFSWEGEPQ